MTATQAPHPRTRTPLRPTTVLLGVVGYLLLLVTAGWVGLTKAGLATVLLTQLDVVTETTAPRGSWGPVMVCTALGIVLVAGARTRTDRIDAVQLGAGLWTLLCLAGFTALGSGWEFTSAASRCVYRSCWPRGYQELALAAPLLVTCVLMGVLATLGRRLPRWARAVVPALGFVLLSIVQVAVWDRLVVPVLNAPPPF